MCIPQSFSPDWGNTYYASHGSERSLSWLERKIIQRLGIKKNNGLCDMHTDFGIYHLNWFACLTVHIGYRIGCDSVVSP